MEEEKEVPLERESRLNLGSIFAYVSSRSLASTDLFFSSKKGRHFIWIVYMVRKKGIGEIFLLFSTSKKKKSLHHLGKVLGV